MGGAGGARGAEPKDAERRALAGELAALRESAAAEPPIAFDRLLVAVVPSLQVRGTVPKRDRARVDTRLTWRGARRLTASGIFVV